MANDYKIAILITQGRRPDRPLPGDCEGELLTDSLWTMIQRCWAQVVQARPSIGEVVRYFHSLNMWSPLPFSGSQPPRRKDPTPLPLIPYTSPSRSPSPRILPATPGTSGGLVTVEARPLHTSNNDSIMSSEPRVRQLGISPDGSNTLASHHSHLSATGHDSNLGLQDPERNLDPWSLTQADAPPDTFIQVQPSTPEPPAVPPKASVRDFLGQRPPSELVTNHLGAFFPGAENRRISDRTGFSRISQTVAIPHPPVQQGQDALHPEEKLRIWQLIETQFPTLRPEAKSHLQQLLEAPLLSRTDDRLSHSQDTFVRPPPELVYDHLDEYFKDHNLDQPIIEASSGRTPSTSSDLPPLSVIQSPQGDGRSGHKKSIRVVVDEHKQRIRNRNSMLDPMPNAPESSTTMVPKRRLSHAHTVNDRS
jgi:hypothetical protein